MNKDYLEKLWKKVGNQPLHGISIPLYSLQSKTSYGIGEYLDLIRLFPWLKSLGFSFVHLLPLNDLGDSSNPYNPISPFALNPLFLSLTQIAHASQREELYHKSKISYNSVRKFKETLLVKFYLDHGDRVSQTESFSLFLSENMWVIPYSESKSGDPKFHRFVQFLCFQQMADVKKAAHQHGIKIMTEFAGSMNKQWKDQISTTSKYSDLIILDHPLDEQALSEVIETTTLFPITKQQNSLGICEAIPYAQDRKFPTESLTYISEPLNDANRRETLKKSHHTPSLLHMTPLNEHLNCIPFLFSYMPDERFSFCIKPNIEEVITNDDLRQAIEECLA